MTFELINKTVDTQTKRSKLAKEVKESTSVCLNMDDSQEEWTLNKDMILLVSSLSNFPAWKETDFDSRVKDLIREFLQKCSGGNKVGMLRSVLTKEEIMNLIVKQEPNIQHDATVQNNDEPSQSQRSLSPNLLEGMEFPTTSTPGPSSQHLSDTLQTTLHSEEFWQNLEKEFGDNDSVQEDVRKNRRNKESVPEDLDSSLPMINTIFSQRKRPQVSVKKNLFAPSSSQISNASTNIALSDDEVTILEDDGDDHETNSVSTSQSTVKGISADPDFSPESDDSDISSSQRSTPPRRVKRTPRKQTRRALTEISASSSKTSEQDNAQESSVIDPEVVNLSDNENEVSLAENSRAKPKTPKTPRRGKEFLLRTLCDIIGVEDDDDIKSEELIKQFEFKCTEYNPEGFDRPCPCEIANDDKTRFKFACFFTTRDENGDKEELETLVCGKCLLNHMHLDEATKSFFSMVHEVCKLLDE